MTTEQMIRKQTDIKIAKLERENTFYREQLQIIASHKRHTIEQRIAASALTFWDELKNNALVAGNKGGEDG